MILNKLIVILGPTASGKTTLSIKLAKKFKGEIISADSRQVYKGMDIGSDKITKKEMRGIPHYLLDVANPKRKFTVSQYQKLALMAIKKIQNKGKIPFLVGGSGFYIQSIVDDIAIPSIAPNWKLRKELQKKSVEELCEILKKLDPKRAKLIDKQNSRRLIRAVEIVTITKKPVPWSEPRDWRKSQFDVLQIGTKKSFIEIKKEIHKKLLRSLKQGLVTEVKELKTSGLSWQRLEEFGLRYRFVAQYIQNKITYQKMIDKLQKETEHFAKHQMTWFKRDERIKWVENSKEAQDLIKKFLK